MMMHWEPGQKVFLLVVRVDGQQIDTLPDSRHVREYVALPQPKMIELRKAWLEHMRVQSEALRALLFGWRSMRNPD